MWRPLLFNNLLIVLDNAIKWGEEIRGVYIRTEKMKLSQFLNDMIVYLGKPRE